MNKSFKYKFHYRPGYGSDELLIEFFKGVEKENFGIDFFDAIKEINPILLGKEDLWMNDEIIYTINTDHGKFTLSKNVWDIAFIISENNQACLLQINNMLLKDERFEKIEVDFNDYKINKDV